jgi:hypothetical protein
MMISCPNSSGGAPPRGGEHLVEALAAVSGGPGVPACAADAVLHDHHRAVDDDAEVQRPQAHQVGADLVADHAEV